MTILPPEPPLRPRPQSLFVPRIHTHQPQDETPRAAEAPDAFRVVSRPSLQRSHTPDLHMPQPAETRHAYESGAYADPPKTRARLFDVGAPLLTDSHTRLITALREECARLHSYTRHLLNRGKEAASDLAAAHSTLEGARAQVTTLKHRNRELTLANVALSQDLQTATDSLAEVDAMFLSVSKKRLSRAGEMATYQIINVQDLPRTPLEAPAQRPGSPTPDRGRSPSAATFG